MYELDIRYIQLRKKLVSLTGKLRKLPRMKHWMKRFKKQNLNKSLRNVEGRIKRL